jgi:DNA-directed RNA polymerase subunit RPC12/RpoP
MGLTNGEKALLLIRRDGHSCPECGVRLTPENWSFDNTSDVPGGDGDLEKLRLVCRECNARTAGKAVARIRNRR